MTREAATSMFIGVEKDFIFANGNSETFQEVETLKSLSESIILMSSLE